MTLTARRSDLYPVRVEFRAGESLSEPVDLGPRSRVFAFHIAAPIAGATTLTFQVSYGEEGQYLNFYNDSGTEVAVTCATGRAIGLDDALPEFLSVRYLRVRLGSSASPVPATVKTIIVLLVRELARNLEGDQP